MVKNGGKHFQLISKNITNFSLARPEMAWDNKVEEEEEKPESERSQLKDRCVILYLAIVKIRTV